MKKATATLANFNCTMKFNNDVKPMLNFFNDIIYPALSDKSLYYETKKNKFYISDLKVIQLKDGPIALVGKHIKRTTLDIYPDYDANVGFIGNQSSSPSAPDSNFILLLNNHRIIYYNNKSGAPTISAFSSTVRNIVFKYITNIRSSILNTITSVPESFAKQNKLFYQVEKSDKIKFFRYEYNGVYYKTLADFKFRYLDVFVPYPEINVVAIESPTLIKEAFENIKKIKKVEFKFYKPNNEPLNFDSIFELGSELLEQTGSTSVKNTLN